MADEPLFYVQVPLRCFEVCHGPDGRRICGLPAMYERSGSDGQPEYACLLHGRPGDRAIAHPAHVLRISVQCQVLFTAATWAAEPAIDEAVGRLRAAVEAAGGLLSVNIATATRGRYAAQAAPPARNASPGRVE